MNRQRFVPRLIAETGGIDTNSPFLLIKAGYLKMTQVAFSLSDKYRSDQLALINRYNLQFQKLLIGAQHAAGSKPMKSVNVAKSYHKVRENAMILYNVLEEKLLSATCSCQVGILQLMGIKSLSNNHSFPQ